MFKQAFLTGCDKNSEWMIDWFFRNYNKRNNLPIIFANFGVSESALDKVSTCASIIDMTGFNQKGWFKKPQAMIEASKIAEKVCWLDTDCQVLANIHEVFTYITPNKLAMAEDIPWSSKSKEKWHNSGVVAFEGRPTILDTWAKLIERSPSVGDQESLHLYLRRDMNRLVHIQDLPNEYNWLRLMLMEGMDSPKKKIMHWTGRKGKQKIMELINDG